MVNRNAGQRWYGRTAWRRPVCHAAPLLALLLAGCYGAPNESPVSWWHGLEGGAIAQQRPPPPGANEPYPNLGTIPPKPPMPNMAAQQQISDRLMLAQMQAEQRAVANPLPPPAPAAASTPRQPTPPPQATNGNSATATLAAASAPPPPPAAAPQPATPPAVSAGSAAGVSAAGTTAAAGAPPAIPDAPPQPPRIGEIFVPAYTAPPPTLPPPPPLPPSKPGEYVWIPFAVDSAAVTPDAERSLRSLATRRHGAPITVVGHGDAISDSAAAQGAALALALRRAHAMANVLATAGVPSGAIQISAAAIGRGGDARLID